MFLFIKNSLMLYTSAPAIQIHLMFLFIRYVCVPCQKGYSFKYISCSYLSSRFSISFSGLWIQIHLMFLFINLGGNILSYNERFKYISCSYLSCRPAGTMPSHRIQIHLMFLFIFRLYVSPLKGVTIQIHLMFLFLWVKSSTAKK